MREYFRPVVSVDPCRPIGAVTLAGGWCWFDRAVMLTRGGGSRIVSAAELPPEILYRLTDPRPPVLGLSMDETRIMGILNITPDSFSDGGENLSRDAVAAKAAALTAAGADIIDIGAESTRPGAHAVSEEEERARLRLCLDLIGEGGRYSVDTRKAAIARLTIEAGAGMVNDVSGLSYDPAMCATVAGSGAALCLVHSQGVPETMQDSPAYDDVLLDVYDTLALRLALAEAAGIPRARVVIDPGIGFGKTLEHNLALLRNMALFHGLGCPLLVGVSRKGLIGVLGGERQAKARMPGSLAVGLALAAQGVQMLRVHDVAETRQALQLWRAVAGGDGETRAG